MTGPLATRDACLCTCHGDAGAPRHLPGGCAECALVHPPGEVPIPWDDTPEPEVTAERVYPCTPGEAVAVWRVIDEVASPADVAVANAIVDRIIQRLRRPPGTPCR